MVNHSVRLFQLVRKYIPQDETRELVNEMEALVRNQMQMETNSLANKFELIQVKDELKNDLHKVHDDLKTLEVRMEAGFKDQLKWTIVLMLGFSSLIIGVLKFT